MPPSQSAVPPAPSEGHALPPPEQPPARQRRAPAQRPPLSFGEVTCEVDDGMCRQLLWGPTQTVLRGRWDWAKVPRNMTSERLAKMPNIPGLHIVVNCRDRVAKILDPLGFRENAQLMRQIAGICKSIWAEDRCPVPPWERRGLSDDDIATWLYWLGREQQAGHLRVISGKIPTLGEIVDEIPQARIRQQFYDSLAYRRDQQELPAEKVLEEYQSSFAGTAQNPPSGP